MRSARSRLSGSSNERWWHLEHSEEIITNGDGVFFRCSEIRHASFASWDLHEFPPNPADYPGMLPQLARPGSVVSKGPADRSISTIPTSGGNSAPARPGVGRSASAARPRHSMISHPCCFDSWATDLAGEAVHRGLSASMRFCSMRRARTEASSMGSRAGRSAIMS